MKEGKEMNKEKKTQYPSCLYFTFSAFYKKTNQTHYPTKSHPNETEREKRKKQNKNECLKVVPMKGNIRKMEECVVVV